MTLLVVVAIQRICTRIKHTRGVNGEVPVCVDVSVYMCKPIFVIHEAALYRMTTETSLLGF